jgi:hypothetical protein
VWCEALQGEYKNHLLNVKVLEGWDYRVVDLRLAEAQGDVNSGARGGGRGENEFMTMLRLVVMMGSAMLTGSANGITP